MRQLSGHALHQRTVTVQRILEAIGSVELEDAGAETTLRCQRWLVTVPGLSGLPEEALLKYEEWFEARGRTWSLSRYHYDYLDRRRGGRFAYHLHGLLGRGIVPHAHCQAPGRSALADHFRSYEIDLLEAHERFAAILAADVPVSCAGLLPLPDW